MFTQPVSSPPPGPSPSNSTRPSRLRGLSYLRNYTQNHLLSRDGHQANSGSTSPSQQSHSLTRSLSHSPSASTAAAAGPRSPAHSNHQQTTNSSSNPPANHLTLVSSTPDPVSRSSAATSNPRAANAIPPTTSTTVPTLSTQTSSASSSAPQSRDEPQLPATDAQVPTVDGSVPAPVTSPTDPLGATDDQPDMTRTRTATSGDAATTSPGASDSLPSIRFSAYFDPRSTRPSLTFSPVSRTLPTGSERVRVGRYSERDSQSIANIPNNLPSAAPVGFKSKVVSRRHCEFWCEDGKWYIKDVKSSSGTFLNHIRLSPPSQESKAFPVNDGDIIQLGIDFKGGEEMIFRCVKMRLELNRGWQNKLNTFNMAAHKRLQNMAATGASAATGSSQDCSICLSSIAPCQSLFVAPCSHTWHFKCVRSLLVSPQYPIFICPNCRAGADLEADVDELAEEWEKLKGSAAAEEDQANAPETSGTPVTEDQTSGAPPAPISETDTPDHDDSSDHDVDPMDVTVNIAPDSPITGEQQHTVSSPLPIRNAASGAGRSGALRESRTPSPPGLTNGTEGPITPRNNAGPWVFDGSAGCSAAAAPAEMRSLDAAADMGVNETAPGDDSGSR